MKKVVLVLILSLLLLATVFSEGIKIPEMIIVEGGEFLMGGTFEELPESCKTVHKVQLTYDFEIGVYALTFGEFETYCNDTGRPLPDNNNWSGENRPVMNISWKSATEYCNWLSKKTGYSPSYDSEGNLLDSERNITTDISKVRGYRLPTNAEFEYAAKGGRFHSEELIYAGSNDIDEVAWFWKNSGKRQLKGDWNWSWIRQNKCRTHEVGTKKSNELGLYDMSGNVWTWCQDYWSETFYNNSPEENPVNLSQSEKRVLRGGSWRHCAIANRVDYHLGFDPEAELNCFGLRLVRTITGDE